MASFRCTLFFFSAVMFFQKSLLMSWHLRRPVRPTLFTLSSPSSCLHLSVLLLLHPVLSAILASSCHLCHPGFILPSLSSCLHHVISVILASSCHLCHPGFILSCLSSWLLPALSVILTSSCPLCHLTSSCPPCHPRFILPSLSSWLHPALSVI